uniref:uncharacterized protein LOC120329663 n=1 Tax=Styela clava TaxID=7725 RepID=UPI00193AB94F|nr:uncharacterized protein LOC120329663 [Styela clava]
MRFFVWIYAFVASLVLQDTVAYFGLTSKGQLREIKPVDPEAIFLAGDTKDEVYMWSENGYYTAPSNGYERIDLSPKPDTDSTQSRGQRLKKDAESRNTNSESPETGISRGDTGNPIPHIHQNTDGTAQGVYGNTDMKPTTGQRPDPHTRLTPSYTRRHAGPHPGYRNLRVSQYPRRPYQVPQFRYPPGMYRYGRDGLRMIASSQGPRVTNGNRQAYRMFDQAISPPVQSVNIDGIVSSKDGSQPAYERYRQISQQQRPATGNPDLHQRSRQGPNYRTSSSSRNTEISDVNIYQQKRMEYARKRDVNGRINPIMHAVHSGKHIQERERSLALEVPAESKTENNAESGDIEIKPLFRSEDIPSTMTFMGVDDKGHAYVKVNEEIDASSFSAALRSDAGSRATDLPPMVPSADINRRKSKKKCDEIKLTRKQRKLCKRDPGLPQVLHEATATSVAECQHQFRFERWNCTTGNTRIHLLSKGNKETAFLFAISSAGLTHSVARACAEGYLERCSCDETYSDHVNQEAWMWGGCGDNVHSASKFVRQFLKPKSRSRDIRAEVDKHNSDMGIRVVRQSVQKTCKCHGVSGSCTTKTCWRKVAPFYEIGQKIKEAYDRSVKVGSINSADGKPKLIRLRRSRRNRPELRPSVSNSTNVSAMFDTTSTSDISGDSGNISRVGRPRLRVERRRIDIGGVRENPRSNELVYLEKSPQYCRRTRFSLGTKGRLCDKNTNCDKICCGRGYTTHIRIVRRSCQCEVRWCCYVECKTCTEKREIHTCK